MHFHRSFPSRRQSSFFPVFLPFTLVFLILFTACFCVYLLGYHKSFFRSYDGFNQHYIGFTYLGQWGRSIVRTILSDHRLVIPLWNPAIGYGADIPTTLTAYLWDPFNWISFFVPSRWAEYAFAVMITMKFYASGLSYLLFARHRKFSRYASLCGAVVYTFSCVSFVAFDQSFFINPLFIFPLLIIGTDLLFAKGDIRLYTIMLFFSLINYFYFAYMMCIFLFLYCMLRVLTEGLLINSPLFVLKTAGRFLICSALAFALSAFHLLPVLSVMTKASRLGLESYLPLVYPFQYYRQLYLGFITFYNMLSRDNIIGFPAAALLCIFILFSLPWKKTTANNLADPTVSGALMNRIRLEFLLMTVGLCLPFFGHLMNGFSYTANRWVWAYDLVTACIVSLAVTELKAMTLRQKVCSAICVFLYVMTAFLIFHPEKRAFFTSACFLVLSTLFLIPVGRSLEKLTQILSFCGICIMLTSNAYYVYSVKHNNGFAHQTEAGAAWQTAMEAGGLPLLFSVDTSDGSRFDKYGLTQTSNATWLYGVSGMNFYVSIYNDYIDQFHNSIALNTRAYTYAYNGLDRRSELERLMGVGHFLTRSESPVRPIGYSTPEAEITIAPNESNTEAVQVRSYRSDMAVSPFYLYNAAVSSNDWQKLNPLDRQQILMKSIVLQEDEKNDHLLAELPNLESSALSTQTESLSDMTVDGMTVTVPDGNGRMLLKLNTPLEAQSGELYVYLDNITYSNGENIGYSISAQALCDGTEIPFCQNSFTGSTIHNPRHGNKTHWLLNLGIPSERTDHILITFQTPGSYSVRGISVGFRPRADIEKNILSLQKTAEETVIDTNHYACKIKCSRESWLFASIPYSSGWSVKDNGKPAVIQRADVAFMAVRLSPGIHRLEFSYCTPGLKAGLALSAAALLLFIFACLRQKKTVSHNCHSVRCNAAAKIDSL